MFKGIVLFCCVLCAAISSAACQIAITSVQMCDASGAVAPWTYTSQNRGVLVNWTVTGAPAATYAVRFTVGDQTNTTGAIFGGGNGSASSIIGYPTLFSLPVTVTIDPGNVSGNTTPATATKKVQFTPIQPAAAVVNYAPQVLFGRQTMSVPVTAGTVTKMVMTLGMPVTQTFQTVATSTSTAPTLVSTPNSFPVTQGVFANVGPGTYSVTQNFKVTVANVACNFKLINPTWADIDALKTTFAGYLGSEPNVEIGDPKIIAFTNATLGTNYRATTTPVQVAEKLFKAVVNLITYKTPAVGDASSVLVNKIGDCGGMSDLFNACLRIAGIPSRLTAGWATDGSTHAWSEFFLPGPGWIPADPSFSKLFDPRSTYLAFFGYHPASNTHCSVYRGGECNTPAMASDFLQMGQLSITNNAGATVGSATTTVLLSTTPLP